MRIVRAAAAILILASCGGGGASATTSAITATTGASTTSVAPAATTTTAAPATTTTAAPDAHPTFGVSWDAVWPDEAETALYRATTGDQVLELVGRVEYGVEFRGATLDRFVVGTPEGGNDGMAIYFDRSEPWVLQVVAVESYRASQADGPELVETFAEPLRLDGTVGVGETSEVESEITIELANGSFVSGVSYRLMPAELEQGFSAAFGTIDDVLRVEAGVGGEFMGGSLFEVILWLHEDHFLVRFEGAPTWDLLELIEPWG